MLVPVDSENGKERKEGGEDEGKKLRSTPCPYK